MMFNLLPGSQAQLITPRQAAFLGWLITQKGKAAYQAAKQRAGIPADVTLLRMSKQQASRLIDLLNGGRE